MIAKELISEVIPALKTSDTGLTALNWMEVFKVTHLPIVNDREFLGLVSETDIYDLNLPEEPLGNHQLSLFRPYGIEEQHLFEIIELASSLKLSLVPILDFQKNYLGVITITDLLHYFADISALKNAGGIVVLEINRNDYSLSQVAQIVEGNDAKILSSFITSYPDSVKLELTLKLNVIDLTSINQTFSRYGYTILSSYMKHDEQEDLLEERLDNLFKFLSI